MVERALSLDEQDVAARRRPRSRGARRRPRRSRRSRGRRRCPSRRPRRRPGPSATNTGCAPRVPPRRASARAPRSSCRSRSRCRPRGRCGRAGRAPSPVGRRELDRGRRAGRADRDRPRAAAARSSGSAPSSSCRPASTCMPSASASSSAWRHAGGSLPPVGATPIASTSPPSAAASATRGDDRDVARRVRHDLAARCVPPVCCRPRTTTGRGP